MGNHRTTHQRVQRVAAPLLAIAAVLTFLSASVALSGTARADCGAEKWEVGCSGEDRRDGEDNQDDNSDSGEEEQTDNTPEPRKGDTWTEYRYTECVDWGEEKPDGYCVASNAEKCTDGTNYYITYKRVWTYNGSEWEYDASAGNDGDGWEQAHNAPDCRDPEEVEEDNGEVTEDVVIRAFNSRPLPSGEIGANPPNGRTLVSLDTIFYTEQGQEEFNLPLTEINQSVQIIATPVSYNWDFGDGNSDSWDTKGQKWQEGVPMSEYTTYSYSETGTFQVELTIDYEVQFNDGSGWQTISEPITSRPSDPFELEVVEKRNRLREGR